ELKGDDVAHLQRESILRLEPDRLAAPLHDAAPGRAGCATEEALGREAEAVGVERQRGAVLQHLVAAREPGAAAMRAVAEAVGREPVADDAEEVEIHVDRLDRRVAAVRE